MKQRWLRNINDGFIYGWDEYIAQNPLVEEVTEEEAFPDRFPKKRIKKFVPKEKPVYKQKETPPELAAEASRGLPE